MPHLRITQVSVVSRQDGTGAILRGHDRARSDCASVRATYSVYSTLYCAFPA